MWKVDSSLTYLICSGYPVYLFALLNSSKYLSIEQVDYGDDCDKTEALTGYRFLANTV